MRTRRVPSSGLAALAVVLSALAVVVVAGSQGPILDIVVAHRAPPPTVVTTTTTTRAPAHDAAGGAQVDGRGAGSGVPTRGAAEPTRSSAPPGTPPPPTSTSSTTSTTTTTVPTTTPTVPTPRPTVLEGWFSGAPTATEWLGPVTQVTVSVRAGVSVQLTVTCGLTTRDATMLSTVTVRLDGGGGACTATFSVPSATPRPTRWHLAAS